MDTVGYVICQFKEMLVKPCYSFSDEHKAWLLELLSRVSIQYLDEIEPSVSLYDCAGNFVMQINTELNSQMIDIAPIWENGQAIPIRPILALEKKEHWNGDDKVERHVIIHEFCHLLSIGKYTMNNNQPGDLSWSHTYGINSYTYRIQEKQFKCISSDELYIANEMVNEIVTSYFLKNIFGEKAEFDQKQRQFEKYINRRFDEAGKNICDIIYWYFTGDIYSIREFLPDDSRFDC